MKQVYNYMIILDALNKYTPLKWSYEQACEIFNAENCYDLTEVDLGVFAVESLTYDRDTGGYNPWLMFDNETLAGAINRINKDYRGAE